MKTLRTPDERFKNLKGFPFEPRYKEVPDGEGGFLRIHYVDEGPQTADPVVLIHGEPSWSYLYRKMIPILIEAGNRAIVPDLVGIRPVGQTRPTRRLHFSTPCGLDAGLA